MDAHWIRGSWTSRRAKGGAAAWLIAAAACAPGAPPEHAALPELSFLDTVEQVGPVAYRDPVGALAPDGRWLAVVERGRLRITPAEGGAARVFGPGTAQIRYLAWFPDSRRVLLHETLFDRSASEWWVYDRTSGDRSTLWPDRPEGAEPPLGELRQLSVSADGARVAGVASGPDGSTVWTLDAGGASAEAVATAPRRRAPRLPRVVARRTPCLSPLRR